MNVTQKIAAVVLLQLMLSSTSHTASGAANAPMDAAGVDLHNLQEYMEQERVARQIKEDRERVKSKIESGDTAPGDQQPVEMRFLLRDVLITPSKVLTAEELDAIKAPYIGREAGVKTLYALVNEINALYKKKGYITCRAFLLDQKIIDGKVTVTLIEGTVGNVKVENNRYTKEAYIKNRLHLRTGDFPVVDRLNDNLRYFNGTNDVQLRIVMKAGEAPHTTDFMLQAYEPQQYSWNLFTDNAGSYYSGQYRIGAFFNVRSLTGERDNLTLGYVHSKGTDAGAFMYRRKLGRSGTTLNLGFNANRVEVTKGQSAGMIDGHASAFSVGISQPLKVKDNMRSEVSLEYTHQKSVTDFDNSTRLVDDRIDDFTAAYAQTNYGNSFLAYQRHSYVCGYHSNDVTFGESGNYGYYKFYGFYRKNLAHGQFFNVRAQAQWAGGSALPSARQFFIGGMNSVRGYRENFLSGDSGFDLSVEYHVPVINNRTTAFAFYDYGSTHGEHAFDDHVLQGAGVGIRSALTSNIYANLTLGVPLKRDVNAEKVSKTRLHFILNGTM